MKKFIFSVAAALCLPLAAPAGEISAGSVPGSINYQGRLERDNAPLTGPVHLHFRLYNSATATGGTCGVTGPCLWVTPAPNEPELTVQAAQGIFSADLTPPIELFAGGQRLYLEVQVESDVLSPREPLSSVAYALVAKKLEDGAGISVTSLTATYQVLLATNTDSRVGIGITGTPNGKLEVNGDIRLTAGSGGVIWFQDGTFISASGISSAGGLSAPGDSVIIADSLDTGTGNIFFRTGVNERARILNNGNMGIGTPVPSGKLDVNGSLFVGDEGIYDRIDGEVNIKEDLIVEGGKITGMNSEIISLGETDNVITFTSNGGERARIHSNDYLGVGIAAPASMIHSGADIAAESGVRGGRVSIGDYSTWTNLLNEVRSENGYHLLLQQTSPYNVGIGTNTPREKLHVRGSIRSDYGLIATTAAFSGDVQMNGNVTALGNNKRVYLTSTTIYGDSTINGVLTVTGGMDSPLLGTPAYRTSTQTFTGVNTFLGQVTVSSNVISNGRLGAGVLDFDFAGSKYLQVGDNQGAFPNDIAMAYLVGGAAGNAKLNFYRGPVESARLETQSGLNLALIINGQTKTLTDATYHRIQNSVVWISTGYAGTPSIFVSSSLGNVGVGTSIMEPNWKLTVDGNLRISGAGNALIFPDGSSMATSSATSASGISTNGNAVVQSDADQFSGGDVILRAGAVDGLVLKSGGNIGIGTLSPVSKLNVRGGDLVLGTPVNPYSGDSIEDLVVGGNIVFDGELLQRSVYPVRISALTVSGDVYLSTGAGKMTGIGTETPLQRLQVAGDINIETGSGIRINNTATSGNYLRGNGTRFVSSGILDVDIPATIVRTSRSIGTTIPLAGGGDLSADRTLTVGGLGAWGAANSVVGMNNAAGAWEYKNIVGVADETDVTHGVNTITIGLVNPVIVAKGGTGVITLANNGVVYGNDAGAVDVTAAGSQYQVLRAGAGGVPAFGTINLDQAAAVTGILPVANGGTGAATLTGVLRGYGTGAFGAMTGTANTLAKWSDSNTIAAGIVTDDGTNAGVGVAPTAGIKLDVGGKLRTTTFQMTTSPGNNWVLASDVSGNATWKSISGSGIGDNWGSQTVSRDGTLIGDGTALSQLGVDLGNINTWTAAQTFSGGLTGTLTGSITGNAATVTTNANLTGVVTSVGNATSIGAGAITNAMLANGAVANLSGTNTGDQTNITGNAGTVTNGVYLIGNQTIGGIKTFTSTIVGSINGNAATVTTNANLTGVVTSLGNATSIGAGAITDAMLANGAVANLSGTNTGDQTNITGNAATATKPAAAGTSGRAVCWKLDGSLGSCSTTVGAGGDCTCI